MNHNRRVVRLKLVLNKALILPRLVDVPSTTRRPNSIDLLLSLAICSRVSKAFSVWPLVTLYRALSGSQGVITAKINKGAAERPRSQRHPKVGVTESAKTTSKHAPKAQKHWKMEMLEITRWLDRTNLTHIEKNNALGSLFSRKEFCKQSDRLRDASDSEAHQSPEE